MILTPELIEAAIPGCAAVRWASPANLAAESWNCTDPMELVFVLAHAAHETQGLTRMEESFAYSAERLAKVWPKRFALANGSPNKPAEELAAAGPEAIANHVYANRMGNGPPESGDGWRYRGRGWPMLTGRENHERYAAEVNKPGPAALAFAEQRLNADGSTGYALTDVIWQDLAYVDVSFWWFAKHRGKNRAHSAALDLEVGWDGGVIGAFQEDAIALNGTSPPIGWPDRLARFRQVLKAFRDAGAL